MTFNMNMRTQTDFNQRARANLTHESDIPIGFCNILDQVKGN